MKSDKNNKSEEKIQNSEIKTNLSLPKSSREVFFHFIFDLSRIGIIRWLVYKYILHFPILVKQSFSLSSLLLTCISLQSFLFMPFIISMSYGGLLENIITCIKDIILVIHSTIRKNSKSSRIFSFSILHKRLYQRTSFIHLLLFKNIHSIILSYFEHCL